VEYEGKGVDAKPKRISSIIVQACHLPEKTHEELEKEVREHVVDPLVPTDLKDENTKIVVNPQKIYTQAGPGSHAGTSGRVQHPFGSTLLAASGHSGTLVQRAGSLACRWMAKSLVDAGLCARARVQLSYAPGEAEPLAIAVDSMTTASVADEKLAGMLKANFDLKIAALVDALDLRKPRYVRVGQEPTPKDVPWEMPKTFEHGWDAVYS